LRLRLRLITWYVVCGLIHSGYVQWFAQLRFRPLADRGLVLVWGQVLLGGLLAAMAVLLVTTPRDAIRLPRLRSEMLILAGTLFVLYVGMIVASPAFEVSWRRVATCAAILLAVVIALFWWLRRRGASPWVAALLAWNPVVMAVALFGRA
jgi:hypothetical protein